MKRLTLILLASSAISLNAQNLKERLVSYAFTAAAGAMEGSVDGWRYHCDQCPDFFNGKNSWLRKYAGRDPRNGPAYFGSTTFLSFTTDAVHLGGMLSRNFNAFALATAPQRKKKGFWHTVKEAAIYNAVYLIPRTVVLELAFKRRVP